MTWLSLSEDFEMHCRKQPAGMADAKSKLPVGDRKERSNGSYSMSVYTDGSATKDQAGWSFILKQGATTFHKSRAVYKDTLG